jgi:hypothetical protein
MTKRHTPPGCRSKLMVVVVKPHYPNYGPGTGDFPLPGDHCL